MIVGVVLYSLHRGQNVLRFNNCTCVSNGVHIFVYAWKKKSSVWIIHEPECQQTCGINPEMKESSQSPAHDKTLQRRVPINS